GVVQQHGRENADEGLVVGEAGGTATSALVEQAADGGRVEIAGGADAPATHQFGDIVEWLAVEEEAPAVGGAVGLLGALEDVAGQQAGQRTAQQVLLGHAADLP